jgi:multisubunit Na+/H+ antiporter MnhF subunit
MTLWDVAAVVLVAALTLPLAVAAFGTAADALAAFEVAGTVMTALLMILSEGFHRQPFIDLALTLGVISLVGALAFARLIERDM